MWSHPEVLEIEKLYTNDTHQVANTYGIEAAGRVIAAVSSVILMYMPGQFLHFRCTKI